MTAPTYFQLSGELYADFGDGRLAVYRSVAVPHGYVSTWVAIPAPDAATLWPEAAVVVDAPLCEAEECDNNALPHLRFCFRHLPTRVTHPHLYEKDRRPRWIGGHDGDDPPTAANDAAQESADCPACDALNVCPSCAEKAR